MSDYKLVLEHHGILGQKWGVRRFQNKDGSLTPEGKKKYQKKYDKLMDRVETNLAKTDYRRQIRAYNDAANKMNNGLIDKYNSDYKKKLGEKAKAHDYGNDDEYINGYNKLFEKVLNKSYNKILTEDRENNSNYIRAQAIVEKYGTEHIKPRK